MSRIVSVNLGFPRTIETPRGPVQTGIFKTSTEARVRAVPDNLEGDGQADRSAHGGPNKAIYGYPIEHYDTWQRELGRDDFTHGQFGENLTTEGLLENEVGVGDVFRIGSAVLSVSQPRSPCYKLGIRMNDAHFVKRFMKSGRPGFYFRIVEPGEIGRGDAIEHVEHGPARLTVWDVWNLSYGDDFDRDRLARALEIPTLAEEWTRPMRARHSR